jgi:predicted membrane protein
LKWFQVFELTTLALGVIILVLNLSAVFEGVKLTHTLIEVLFSLRGVRFARLLLFIPAVRILLLIILHIHPVYMDLVANLFILFFMYAAIGNNVVSCLDHVRRSSFVWERDPDEHSSEDEGKLYGRLHLPQLQ